MKRYDMIIVGAGPAGLSAAIQAAHSGVKVAVFDENEKPGGQLFKQIHKFFGSKEHHAKIRGLNIGKELLQEAADAGVVVHLHAVVMGLYDNKEILVNMDGETVHYKADVIVVATGARENMIPFVGWTLPGVMGAGAAQTLMNLHGVQPGQKVLMVGSGNVGLVVGYQLLQAGVKLVAVIDAAPCVGGYGVHASKLARMGVPFYLSHTVIRAEGVNCVTGAVIAQVDEQFKPISGTEKHLDVDTICMAVGLSPMSQLTSMIKCQSMDRAGTVPVVNEWGETSVAGIFAVGDVAGIEEASSAMISGQIVGNAVANRLGYLDYAECKQKNTILKVSLQQLREGMFSPTSKGHMQELVMTEEGIPLSQNLLKNGYLDEEELDYYPGIKHMVGVHPVIECTQNIPCNPCQDACKFNCIKVGDKITRLPQVDCTSKCTGCGLCVAACSGQAIFLVNEDIGGGYATVTIPYELLPYPKTGEQGIALGRDGKPVCKAQIVDCKNSPAYDHTALLTIRVPQEMVMKARFFRREDE